MIDHKTDRRGEYREIADLTATERHRLLASEQRRTLTTVLPAHSSPVDLGTLAEEIADRDAVGTASVEQIKQSLHHKHLPMLADMDTIAFDAKSGRIEFSENWSY
jgi:hypothetical protein